MTFSADAAILIIAAAALLVVGVSLWRAMGLLHRIADSHARSGERHAILQDRFVERMYEKANSDPRAAGPLAQLHARESGQSMRDELLNDGANGINRQLAMEAAKIRREREHPVPDATAQMDLGV